MHCNTLRRFQSSREKPADTRKKFKEDLQLAAHFARFIGLECIDEVSRGYGDEGVRLAHTIDPSTIPGAQPFQEQTLQPVVMYKGDSQTKIK